MTDLNTIWEDGPDGGTPVNAERLNNLEARTNAALYVGKELAAAQALNQQNLPALADWVDVAGLEMTISTGGGPVYLRGSVGLCILDTTTSAGVELRILDATEQRGIAYATARIMGDPSGYDSTGLPAVEARLESGLPERRYVVQIKSTTGTPGHIIPDWLEGSVATFAAIGA